MSATAPEVATNVLYAELAARVAVLEARPSEAEQTTKEKLDEFQRQQAADSKAIAGLVAAVGEAPDDSTGREGSGMRKQLAMLIVASKRPTLAAYLAAFFTAVTMVYQFAKGVGWIK